jgi:hypothetical protein
VETERGGKSRKGVNDKKEKDDNGRRAVCRSRLSMKWLLLEERSVIKETEGDEY